MEHNSDQNNWTPIEGLPKQRRPGPRTKFAKKRANHRNAILKDWSEWLEPEIEPKVPIDYTCPFDKDKCAYFFPPNIGHAYITLAKENHMIYGTSGFYSSDEEYKTKFDKSLIIN